jgi:hypothetical protein
VASEFDPEPFDYAKLIADGIPELRYTSRPCMPEGASVLAVGPAASMKSM